MNTLRSPWRSESEMARDVLLKSGFLVIDIEVKGIEGPEFRFEGRFYQGYEEIRDLARSARESLDTKGVQ